MASSRPGAVCGFNIKTSPRRPAAKRCDHHGPVASSRRLQEVTRKSTGSQQEVNRKSTGSPHQSSVPPPLSGV
ncbi:hypothetical protein EYF80_066917 [Liparis tanakae]|uniref:Uncharacterized protein n=1 Tax=Liparis tanakae TaxID=230148 RepID=A0A4Z2E2K6_9TELE|nr:hypothetical protein EYF80_066917 [Liparis tanakae]